MRLEHREKYYLVIDDRGKIALLTHHKGIAERFIEKNLNFLSFCSILIHNVITKEAIMTDKLSVNPFDDIDIFGTACDQKPSPENYSMYLNLIAEEYGELQDAVKEQDELEQLDALVDILVVTMGAIRAAGWDGAGAWEEVMRTNFAKIDPRDRQSTQT